MTLNPSLWKLIERGETCPFEDCAFTVAFLEKKELAKKAKAEKKALLGTGTGTGVMEIGDGSETFPGGSGGSTTTALVVTGKQAGSSGEERSEIFPDGSIGGVRGSSVEGDGVGGGLAAASVEGEGRGKVSGDYGGHRYSIEQCMHAMIRQYRVGDTAVQERGRGVSCNFFISLERAILSDRALSNRSPSHPTIPKLTVLFFFPCPDGI